MIKRRDDYVKYLEQDRLVNGILDDVKRLRIGLDAVWRWLRLLRKTRYIVDYKRGVLGKLYELALKYCFHRESLRLFFQFY